MVLDEMVDRVRVAERRRAARPGRAVPPALVVGGTYVDRVSMLRSEPVAGRTTEVATAEEVLGGPGLCLALALRRLGARVALATAVGDGPDSDRAMDLLRDNGISVFADRVEGPLDRSDLYVAPSGERVVYNTHAISRTAAYARLATPAASTARVVVIGSPTPVRQAEEIAQSASPDTLLVALLHSRQLKEVAGGRTGILSAAHVVCVSEGDAPLLRGRHPGPGRAFVTTMGAAGVRVLIDDVELVVAQPNIVQTRQSNGAGEAFCAALSVALVAGWHRQNRLRPGDLRAAVDLAQCYAAIHLSAGGNLAFPQLDLARLAERASQPVLAG
jgi:sugar/nucleoside kinase (ribokinase family)